MYLSYNIYAQIPHVPFEENSRTLHSSLSTGRSGGATAPGKAGQRWLFQSHLTAGGIHVFVITNGRFIKSRQGLIEMT